MKTFSIPKFPNSSTLILCCLLVCCLSLQSCSDDEIAATQQTTLKASAKPGPVILDPAATYITPAVEDIVMYEINIGSFSSTRNLRGIINRLDQIKALGVNTIWLMPTYPIGQVNSFGSPYCVRNYLGVNPSYGNLQDLRELVTKAHKRKLSVILDWVGNHTSWDNVWMSHPDWYTRNASGQIISPAGTGWNDVADLNFDNAEMRLEMIAAMRYWIDIGGVDGFRCDAANYVPSDFWQQAITALQTGRTKQLIMLSEGDQASQLTAGFKMNWSFAYTTALKNVLVSNFAPSGIFNMNANEYAAIPSGTKKLRFTTNHDESNNGLPVTVYGSKTGAMCASAITIFLQGVPLIYSGQEVGVASTSVYNNGTIDWTANGDMLADYQKMLAFYNSSVAARKGTLQVYADTHFAAYSKTFEGEQIVVIANTRPIIKAFTVPPALAGTYLNVMTNTVTTLPAAVGFAGHKYLILKKIGG